MSSKRFLFLLCAVSLWFSPAFANPGSDAILGQWMSTRRNVKVQVYKEGAEFKGRVTWFKDNDDPSKPMATRLDENNPDPKLRKRKVLGMQVLSRLEYNAKTSRWENGRIYDPKTGRQWSSVAYLDTEGVLNVKGYWQFEFIGKTMRFRKVS
ncbi:DUF2147 domain-containing protein [Daejeonella sp.]|uniref:DUF2147 domain-containing protein n=1 Tax=Daejeonella sp. TaxID=2805397 RepID=UPI0030C4E583